MATLRRVSGASWSLLLLGLLLVLEQVLRSRFGGRRLGARVSGSAITDNEMTSPSAAVTKAQLITPAKFERLGHVVLVRQRLSEEAAKAFARRMSPPVHVVLLDEKGISGELRLPAPTPLYCGPEALGHSLELLSRLQRKVDSLTAAVQAEGSDAAAAQRLPAGLTNDADLAACVTVREAIEQTEAHPCLTTIVEGGTKYIVRADAVMFCSGNGTERMHFRTAVKCREHDTVVDMFAGVGYFTVPLSCNDAAPGRIFAIEKNPMSARLLCLNVVNNRGGRNGGRCEVTVLGGDNRVVGESCLGTANRVIMGYIPDCSAFLPRALAFLKTSSPKKHNATSERRGVIHYHFLAPSRADAYRVAMSDVVRALGEDAVAFVAVSEIRVVKSFAPRRWHCVADLIVGQRFLT
jgi:tRNA wybutosine-synthesizing protein 2